LLLVLCTILCTLLCVIVPLTVSVVLRVTIASYYKHQVTLLSLHSHLTILFAIEGTYSKLLPTTHTTHHPPPPPPHTPHTSTSTPPSSSSVWSVGWTGPPSTPPSRPPLSKCLSLAKSNKTHPLSAQSTPPSGTQRRNGRLQTVERGSSKSAL
jgi:hypothetical protein